MVTSAGRNISALKGHIEQVQVAASKLRAQLADRAAYASPEEYEEIRALMTALRNLGATEPPSSR